MCGMCVCVVSVPPCRKQLEHVRAQDCLHPPFHHLPSPSPSHSTFPILPTVMRLGLVVLLPASPSRSSGTHSPLHRPCKTPLLPPPPPLSCWCGCGCGCAGFSPDVFRVMYPNMKSTHQGYSLYFVIYYFICTSTFVTIITSVVIDGYSVSKEVRALFLCLSHARWHCWEPVQVLLCAWLRDPPRRVVGRARGDAFGPASHALRRPVAWVCAAVCLLVCALCGVVVCECVLCAVWRCCVRVSAAIRHGGSGAGVHGGSAAADFVPWFLAVRGLPSNQQRQSECGPPVPCCHHHCLCER
jgi:hypothetical protein